MNKPLEKIFSAGKTIQMTSGEKNSLRLHLAQYMRRHSKGVSPYLFFRASLVGALTIMLFLGTGGVAVFASQKSTPGNTLYPVKRSVESIKKIALVTPEQKASYELELIQERFSEVNTLITNDAFTPENETIITDSIKEHTDNLQEVTAKLAITDPAEALSYTNQLATTLKTSTETLIAFAGTQSQYTDNTPTTLVLASYETARKIDQETQDLQEIILSDTNIATVRTAEKKYKTILALAEKQPELFTAPIPLAKSVEQPQAQMMIATFAMDSTPAIPTLPELFTEIQNAYANKEYGKVILLSETVDKLIAERTVNTEPELITEPTSGTMDTISIEPVIPILEKITEKPIQ